MAFNPNNPNGRAAAAASEPVVLSNEDKAAVDLIAANQATEIAALVTIATKDFSTETTLAAQNVLIGATNEAAAATDTSTSGLNGLLKRIAQRLTSILTALGSPFQAGGSIGNTSFGVNNASGASAVNIQDGGNSITVDGTVTVNAGTNLNTSALATSANQTAQSTLFGAVTETAPASDTASSGLNGRLQRIAQRITSLIALLPTALTGSGNFKVAVQEALPAGTANIGDVDVASIAAGTNYIGKTRITDGTTDAEVIPLAGYNAAAVALVDASGNHLTSLGGGTEYTEDNVAAAKPVGKISIFVREDNPAGVASINGDNVGQRGTEYGAGYVTLLNSSGAIIDSFGSTQPTYGTDTVMTVTNLHSLATSPTAGWRSDFVSNLSTKAADWLVGIKLDMANTAPASTKAVYIYICAWWTSDGGTTWYSASQGTTTLPTSSQGTTTIASPNDLRLLGVLSYTTADMVLQNSFLLSECFGARMPQGFSIIIINDSGAAIAASGNLVYITPIT